MEYFALSTQQLGDIHLEVASAYSIMALPVVFSKIAAGSRDSLYDEGANGVSSTLDLPAITASVTDKPSDEILTRFGLMLKSDLLVIIPRQFVLDWQAETGDTFIVDDTMFVAFGGRTYDITQVRTDELPVDGGGTDWVLMAVTARIKPNQK